METEPVTPLRPRMVPIADLTPDNLKALIRDMDAEPGWHTSSALYAWYLGMARESGLEPVTQKKFGTVMRELGFRPMLRRSAGQPARCWFIPRHAIRSAQEAGH